MPDLRIAWWNLENLFDEENASRPSQLAQRLERELEGWTIELRDRKLDQLALIIKQMFDGEGPDLLGVCEVENETVLQLLVERITIPGRDYRVIAHESPDARGIDVSFIVDVNILSVNNTEHQVIVRRNATRDLFWVELAVRETGAVFIAMANHWPSRSGGQYATEPFRMLAGETASFVLSTLFEQFEVEDNLPIILMGDFNDEPFNRSVQEYLLGTRDANRVRRSQIPRLLNLMWPLMTEEDPGTFRFRSDWNMLDHFLISKGMLLNDSPIRVRPESVAIFRPDQLKGSGNAPRRFGRPSRNLDSNGFSDHFPITVIIEA